jgi:hypothetical protein
MIDQPDPHAFDVFRVRKVKTTQPKRYYVRPNQGFMREGGCDVIAVILVEKECRYVYVDWREFLQLHRLHQLPCRELLMSAARGNRENNTDRFLVMSMPIDDETYDRLSRSTEREKGDEVRSLCSLVTLMIHKA